MGALGHCLPVDGALFWARFSLCPCGFLGNICHWLRYLSLHCYLSQGQLTGQNLPGHWDFISTDTAQHKLHHENIPFPPLVTPSGRFCRDICRVVRYSSSAEQLCQGPAWETELATALEGRSGRPWSQLSLELLSPTRCCPCAQPDKPEAGRCSRLWHTYSLNLFTHSYTFGFSSQHCVFSLLSPSFFPGV